MGTISDILPQRVDAPLAGRTDFYGRMANPGRHGWSLRRPTRYLAPGAQRPIIIWLPLGATSGRVLVFSHGELGGPELYSPLLNHWSSHGYIILAPVHDDSLTLGSMSRGAEIRNTAIGNILTNHDIWNERIQDIKSALDVVPRLKQETGLMINDERPIIVGHALGAFVAQLIMGVRPMIENNSAVTFADTRFFGGLFISPHGRGILGLRDTSWEQMRTPTMWVSGPGDIDASGQQPQNKIEGFYLSPPGNRHLGWFARISPPWYGGQVRPGDIGETVYADFRAFTTAFLRSYADYDEASLQEFASERFNAAAGGRAIHSFR